METIRVGIIGAGGIAQYGHLPAYQKIPGVEVAAVADINEKKSAYVAERFGIPQRFVDYREMLEKANIDAVSICTPNYLHREMSVNALNAGKHVLCEKPVAVTGEDAEAIVAAAEASGKVFMAAFCQRFTGASRVLKKFIEEGKLGDIYYAKGSYIRRRGIPGLGGWFTTKSLSGGGCMLDIGVHVLDRVYWLMGAPEPVAVSGAVYQAFRDNAVDGGWPPLETRIGDVFVGINDVEDMASGYVQFANGATLVLEASWAGNCEPNSYLQLFGTKAGALEDARGLRIFGEEAGSLLDIEPLVDKEINVYEAEIAHFIDCIREGKQPLTTAREIINVAKIIEAVYLSANQNGRQVEISEL
ncbi:MAG TPA: Gfo/Idh/MocA family oxidoreductase [Firmicutes bacterium]|nr:Gfo/Idh/MocA family oxidoreductase [Bacillota bacterium]